MVLYAPKEYWLLADEEKAIICNGCGPKGKFDFVPDKIYRLSIAEACNIHDYMYHIGTDIGDKEAADRVFLNNMLRIVERKTNFRPLRFLRRRRAYKYYLAVKHFGAPAYWSGKNG